MVVFQAQKSGGIVIQELAKPEWLKIRPSPETDFSVIKSALRKRGLVTVCEEAHCPNMAECWHNQGTATFMILGDTCTRGCRFCAVKTAMRGRPVDPEEPRKLAEAIREMGLDYAVITSVDRDDLPDQGAGHFARCIRAIKETCPQTLVEVLVPDFRGDTRLILRVVEACPDVFAHNIETVRRLQKEVRDPRAGYEQSLLVLEAAKKANPGIITKSSIMLGLGESRGEVLETMRDLRNAGVGIITLGQYLKPKNRRLPVREYVAPGVFEEYKRGAESMGFLYAASGPFVRSSYRAGEFFVKALVAKKK